MNTWIVIVAVGLGSGLGVTLAAAPLVAVVAAVIAVLRTGSSQAAILVGMPVLWIATALLSS